MVHQLDPLDTMSIIGRVQISFKSSLCGTAAPSTGVVEIRVAAKTASLTRVSEAIASLTKRIIPIFIATFALFVLLGVL
jgi:hypothetical protein